MSDERTAALRARADALGRAYDAAQVAATAWRRTPAWRRRLMPLELRAAMDELAQHMGRAR